MATIVTNRAPPKYTSHFNQSEVSGCGADVDSGGGGDDPGAGDGFDWAGGDSVVKALTALQALDVPEPVALTFQ